MAVLTKPSLPALGSEDYTMGPPGSGPGGSDPSFTTWSDMTATVDDLRVDTYVRVTGSLSGESNYRLNNIGGVGSPGTYKVVIYSLPADRGNGHRNMFTIGNPTTSNLGCLRWSTGGATCNVELHGLVFENPNGSAAYYQQGTNLRIKFYDCVFQGFSSGGSDSSLNMSVDNAAFTTFVTWNCIYDCTAGEALRTSTHPNAPDVQNCLFRKTSGSAFRGWRGNALGVCRNTGFFNWGRISGPASFENCAQGGSDWDSLPLTDCKSNVSWTDDPTATGWIVENSTNDFRLKAATSGTNEAINAGSTDTYTNADQIEVTRPQGSQSDMGPFEYQEAGGVITGTGAMNAQSATMSGTGTRFLVISGTGTMNAQSATMSGTGELEGALTGSGAMPAQSATMSGTGSVTVVKYGTGAMEAGKDTPARTGRAGAFSKAASTINWTTGTWLLRSETNPPGTVMLLVDGQSETVSGLGTFGTGSPLYIGGLVDVGSFKGVIRDFKVYNSSNTLIHHWPIDDGDTEITDVVGGANGTLTIGSGQWVKD